jgi:hypothetical protein
MRAAGKIIEPAQKAEGNDNQLCNIENQIRRAFDSLKDFGTFFDVTIDGVNWRTLTGRRVS